MSFGDCSTEAGLKALNDHLATRSYVEGYAASAADAAPFAQVGKATHGLVTQFAHVTRWYMHILSFPEIAGKAAAAAPAAAAKKEEKKAAPAAAPAAAAPAKKEEKKKEEKKDEDDIDLFGEDDDEAEREKEERRNKLAQEQLERKKKEGKLVIAKSSIILDVKPWDDETDMVELEKCVRSIEMEGLVWGWSKLVPVGYGIKKLQINCVVVDDLVSVDDLEEKITGFEDHVQSMDVSAFNKL